jgi:pimeloyl-ACP methyl ester carboxylesterase
MSDETRTTDVGTLTPSTTGSTRFDDLYDRAVADLLDVPVDETWVETRYGETHVLLAGEAGAPPVLLFQGGNVTNPITLAWIQDLADEYYLVAPDTPGEPGKSDGGAPNAYGPWVADVADAFEFEAVPLVGISHGAGVVLETAAYAPHRISEAVLVVPAGFGTPLALGLARVVLPALGYRLVPNRRLLRWALAGLFTDPLDAVPDVVVETVGLALRTSDLAAEFPGPDDATALHSFEAPTLLITAENDPFFPGQTIATRAEAMLPSLAESVMLAGERHFLSTRARQTVTTQIRSFLAQR